ncbi:peptidoglycan DD-metalloendopeptidase family protein [Cohnella cellulosilytica]|uniref:Peptidoglycan DD-metalloendopeptidase family protein n=1 Tax=Cohnella cellulosilytica TaxID=986710 RepID=A0ABW2FBQ2_9BACL
MQIRDNVRERRRERIAQLVERQTDQKRQSAPAAPPREETGPEPVPIPPNFSRPADKGESYAPPAFEPANSEPERELLRRKMTLSDPDPELWWREREKRLKTGQAPGWQGLKGIPPTSASGGGGSSEEPRSGRFLRGVGIRLVVSALALGGFWGWMKLELPGSAQAKDWMVSSVTRDMDFRAIEVWYGDTFGGSPTFLPFGRGEPKTLEASALLDPSITSAPIRGTIVETYAENGQGVRVAAAGNGEVYAVFTGKVQQVTRDSSGGVTILVQHQNRVLTVYGGLASADVKPNDWVETGQTIGRLDPAADGQSGAELYFAVQHDGNVLDPAEVVTFD